MAAVVRNAEEMTEVRLSGQLICADQDEIQLVAQHLPSHVELTRQEPGCLLFEVSPTEDSMIWQVEEVFRDAAAFGAHQQRVAQSEWGRATAKIHRDYTVSGLGIERKVLSSETH